MSIIFQTMLLFVFFGLLPVKDATSTKENYIGEWKWIRTEFSDRGGLTITTSNQTREERSIKVTADYQLALYKNGKRICSEQFNIKDQGVKPFGYNITGECLNGRISVEGDTLQLYVYRGCPSSTSFYVKMN
jgi:hypothetical protein